MSQSTYDRCLIIFALLIIILAILVGCAPETAVSPTTIPTSAPTGILPIREQYDEPVVGELSFEERPSPSDPASPNINLIFIKATLQADDSEVSVDGRGLETPLLQLSHCGNYTFDGEQLTLNGTQLPPRATHAVIIDYIGISLSAGGSNIREKILSEGDTEYHIPLALDTNFTFYTIKLDDPYKVSLWQGEQNDNRLTTSYRRPVEGQSDLVTLGEDHLITIIHNVPVTYRDPIPCE